MALEIDLRRGEGEVILKKNLQVKKKKTLKR